MAIEMKMIRVKMTKPLYLGMSILDISKILMYKFWYDYIKPKYGDRAKLCQTDTDTFIIFIKTEGTKKCAIKQKLMFENYKDCLFNNKTVY